MGTCKLCIALKKNSKDISLALQPLFIHLFASVKQANRAKLYKFTWFLCYDNDFMNCRSGAVRTELSIRCLS